MSFDWHVAGLTVGQVAERMQISASAVRWYADQGLVRASGLHGLRSLSGARTQAAIFGLQQGLIPLDSILPVALVQLPNVIMTIGPYLRDLRLY